MKAHGELFRFWLVGRTLASTAFAAAATRAIPLFGGVALVAGVLFSPVGMDARDVTRSARNFPLIRLSLWAAWLIGTTPLARTLLSAPGAAFLRALPVPRWQLLVPLAAALLLLQGPFALLWGRGEGLASGIAVAIAAASAEALIVARPARIIEQASAVAAAFGIALSPRAPILIALSLPGLGVGVWAAFVRARHGGQQRFGWVKGPATVALLLAHIIKLLRAEVGLVARGMLLAVLGGALAAIGARNNDHTDPAHYTAFSLAVSAIPLTIAVAGPAGAVQRAEARVRWLLDASGTSGATRAVAAMGAAAASGASFGLIHVAFGVAADAPLAASLRAAPSLAAWGTALGAIAGHLARRAELRGKQGGGSYMGEMAMTALASLGAAALLDNLAPIALGAVAVVFAVRSAKLAGGRGQGADKTGEGGGDALSVEGVRKRYGGRFVLEGVTFRWPGPGVLVVHGENGAGKSTLLEIVAGVAEKTEGAVTIGGASLETARRRALAQIGYVPDAMDLPEHLTVRELAALCSALRQVEAPGPALVARLGVTAFHRDRLGVLSLGQRRRACLLAALAGEPRLLILDEPTNGLDAEGVVMLRDLLRERTAQGRSALIATHDRAFRDEVADGAIGLVGGRAVELGDVPACELAGDR